MIRKLSFTIVLFCSVVVLSAQFKPNTTITASQYGSNLDLAFMGGVTAPQFSDIDVNQDGLMDLFIFDRGAWRPFILLRDISGDYTYAPQYEKIFPHMEDWALIRDYNCDDVPDIFTYSIGSTAVYKGSFDGGSLHFTLVDDDLTYVDGTGTTSLYTSRTDIPGIADIDQDGDIDVLSFSVSNATIRFYKNISAEQGYGCDSLIYDLVEYCWGEIFEEASCAGATMNVACKGGGDMSAASEAKIELHIGSTIVTYDTDGDGDHDAMIGDNLCNNIVFFRNGGTTDFAQMSSKDTAFSSTNVSFDLALFPAAYLSDVDDDGDEDMLITTNDHLIGANMQNVWLYENLNTNDTFDLVYATDTFLVSEFIDAGIYSKPTFFDYNNDDLMDILVGVGSTLGKDDVLKHGLWLYENVGTPTSPSFELVSTDYAGLNAYPISQLSPVAGDIDNDGDDDLLIGINDGTICYLQNIGGPTGEAIFTTAVFVYQGIDVGQLASPCLIDIDEDGKLDLVIGEQNGNLNYYHNTGTATSPVFTSESDIWGGVDVRKPGFITGYSSPFMYRNENDSLYLLVGSQSGFVYAFNEIEDALLGEFYEKDTNYLKWDPGVYASIYGQDITGDGEMEFLVGTIRGGIQIFERDKGTAIAEISNEANLQLFPNPSDGNFTITWDQESAALVEVYTMMGNIIWSESVYGSALQVNLPESIAKGVYMIRVSYPGARGTLQYIKQ
ncbi:MAG TPA: T9SS type A sorting domain-containing protein [Chitinophagales bacterium]|nr:T9SS type A sorting domain-containing protein [Chitinophagales bacterium]